MLGPINIGLVLGVAPVEKDYISRRILEKDLLDLFEKLRTHNILGKRMPDINSFSFILDSRTGQIVQDGVECKNQILYLGQDRNKINVIENSKAKEK